MSNDGKAQGRCRKRGPWAECPNCHAIGNVQWDGRNDVCVCLSCGYTNELRPMDYDAPGFSVREQGV